MEKGKTAKDYGRTSLASLLVKQLLVRVTFDEINEINKKAKESGDTQSGYVRRLLGLAPYPKGIMHKCKSSLNKNYKKVENQTGAPIDIVDNNNKERTHAHAHARVERKTVKSLQKQSNPLPIRATTIQ